MRSSGVRTLGVAWAIVALFIVYGTTIPFDVSTDWDAVQTRWQRVSLNPLVSPESGRRLSIPDVTQNVLLFLPFGALGALWTRRGGRGWGTALAGVSAAGALWSAGVEGLQLFTSNRVTSLADVCANTAGAGAGVALAGVGSALAARHEIRLRTAGLVGTQAGFALLTAFTVVVIAAWEPFDPTLDVGTVATKVKWLLTDPWQAGVPRDEVVAFVHYALLAAAAAAWARTRDVTRPALAGLVWSSVLVLVLEASQLFVSSRMPALSDVAVRIAGGSAGVVAWREAGSAAWIRSTWPAWSVAGLAAGAAVMMLSPFEWRAEPGAFQWFPFLNYYARTSLQTVSHVFDFAFTFFPMGFVMAWAWPGPGAKLAVPVAIGVSSVLEWSQRFAEGRYGDVTDIGMAALMAFLGAWVAGAGRQAHSTKNVGKSRNF